MADDVVRGPAVHSKAEEARRALHAARRRRPAPPADDDAPSAVPLAVVPSAAPDLPQPPTRPGPDTRVERLTAENQALRAEIAELRRTLARIEQEARQATGD